MGLTAESVEYHAHSETSTEPPRQQWGDGRKRG
jgi:ABC-2 type transport system ATP-binding protein